VLGQGMILGSDKRGQGGLAGNLYYVPIAEAKANVQFKRLLDELYL
jgi:hypothetical protein